MPIYTFRCSKCGLDEDVILAVDKRNTERLHSCGSPMQRLMSLPLPAIFKLTGREMALDTLNSGMAMPNRWYKAEAERLAASGLEKSEKVYY